MQADDEIIRIDSNHLAASRAGELDAGFWPLSRNEVDRCRAAVSEYLRRRAAGIQLCAPNDLIVHSGDDPRPSQTGKGWLTWSATSNQLPCLRRSGGLYVSTHRCRHLTLEEMYGFMGFASLPIFAEKAALPLYKFDRAAFTFWQYRRALGNAQHVAHVGVIMTSALASCALLEAPV